MKRIVVTNNRRVYDRYRDRMDVTLLTEASYLEVLKRSRDYVEQGGKLLMHPTRGAAGPGRSPFKSLLIGMQEEGGLCDKSLKMVKDAIDQAEKNYGAKADRVWKPMLPGMHERSDLSRIELIVGK